LDDFFKYESKALENYKKDTIDYKFSNDIPKYKCFIRIKEGIDPDRRDYIANGVRGFFKSDLTILVDMAVLSDQIASSVAFFNIFVTIIGVIALTLAFFLLLVSTTQNVKA
jgi:hypothetical protein